MTRIEAFPNVAWHLECLARRRRAVASLRELVAPGVTPTPICDPITFVHKAFDLYRDSLQDNDSHIFELARIESNFIAALCALNFDDTTRQLRAAMVAIEAFAR
ncbi:MAG: hypothetical protein JWS10_643 [Cypionkella sp.]|uniref:hypothetical protein n=1 Tax=Cypionkella sp. TaxID=2811411 RepID=UPI0026218703|nr:hypothetical protein [Cypionkella sp.]MDB5658028.1 hypothetical protein [Cypionkella sp.]